MKKLLSIIAISVMLLPLGAKAGEFKLGCEKSCPTEDGKCTSVCTVKAEGNTSALSEFNGTLEVVGDGVKVTSLTPGTGWMKISPTDTELNSKTIPLNFTANPAISDNSFLLMTVNLELESSATDCSLKLYNAKMDIVTETTVETTTTTKTGASLPVVIIAGGAIVAIAIYTVTKKNKKLYKI